MFFDEKEELLGVSKAEIEVFEVELDQGVGLGWCGGDGGCVDVHGWCQEGQNKVSAGSVVLVWSFPVG